MVSRAVNNFLEKVASDHIGIMDLEVRVLVHKLEARQIGQDVQRYSRNSPTRITRDTVFDGSEK